ncbi:hypothetical protein D9758_006479 [Tetrapyrgos nigripes]|uniref:Protein kinase domain-containing protein n=1 Tax=Tetrapyrgos nigripes TaxID=182062 RepID=A0A8H5GKV8_9AGAR|nr:hypothetical protein D9758_006479 [Tetrapyrgos nigripes]
MLNVEVLILVVLVFLFLECGSSCTLPSPFLQVLSPLASGMPEEPRFSGDLDEDETFWRDHASWLREKGYQLRPRYQPDWKPSWLAKKSSSRFYSEDGSRAKEPYHLMDALRVSDGMLLMLKKLEVENLSEPTRELRMNQILLSGTLESPQNHCIPIYEILNLPEDEHQCIVVMPFLEHWWPRWWNLPFSTIGEAVGFLQQLFEGVQTLHHHHIAHNDIKWDNVMVDSAPLYSRPMHPTQRGTSYDWKHHVSPKSITRHPVRYFLIDFDLTEQYDPKYGPARQFPGYGGDRSVPEFKAHPSQPCDPFPVEIYRLGNLIRRFMMSTQRVREDGDERLGKVRYNPSFNFLSDLVTDMTQDDPAKRPDIDEVVKRFDEIVHRLGYFKLRSQFWPGHSGENWFVRTLWKTPRHFVSQVINTLGRYPPVPPTPGLPKGRKGR